jgi:cytochrome c-type biogenesis protein CcmH/NrfG
MVNGLQARLERDGGDAAAWARLAQARSTLGQQDSALAAWNKALELSPNDPELLKGKGRSLLGAAAPSSDLPTVPDAANDLFRQVAGLRPDDPETNWYLGIRALQDKQFQQAREHWQRALDRLDPASPEYAAMQSRMATLPPS